MSTTADTLAQLVNNTDNLLTETREIHQTFEDSKDTAVAAAGTATTQAGIATDQATEATDQAVVAQQAKNQTQAIKDATENLKNQAQAITVSGDVSYTPAPNQVPLARANGSIDPQWIKGALKPVNWIEAGSAESGVLVPDSTEYDFTAQMARFIPPIFIPETMTEEIVVYSDGPLGIFVTTDKKIRVNHYGIYESEPLNVNNDWVTFGFGKADNQSDTVTIYFIANGRQIGSTIVGDFSDLAVRAIFQDGTVDGFYGCASPAHGYQDSAGTERINNPGDPVGYDYDLSPNEVDASQGTSTARPLIGRQPLTGVRNRWSDSDDISAASWSLTRVSVPESRYPAHDGTFTAQKLTEDDSDGSHVLARWSTRTNFRNSFDIKSAGRTKVRLRAYWSNGPLSIQFDIDLETGVISNIDNASFTLATELPNGWWRVGIGRNGSFGGGSMNAYLYLLDDAGNVTYQGDGESGVLVRYPQSESDNFTDPQITGDDSSYLDCTEPGVQDVWFHQYGLDDVMPRTLPAITDGTIIIGGKKGIWIDTLTVDAGTFSFEDGLVYPGGPGGLYALIGDLVGWFVIDATLTEPEKTAVINWLKQKGCPGDMQLSGVELITNGTYDTDVADWLGWGADITWDAAGKMHVTQTASNGAGQQAITTEVDEWYLLTADYSDTEADTRLKAQTGTGYNSGALAGRGVAAGSGSLAVIFQATTTTTYARCEMGGGSNEGDFDNVSVQKLTLNTGA